MATPSRTDLQRAVSWVTRLALLTSGGRTPPTQEQIGLYATMLATELPAACLTDASLSVVKDGSEFFPAFAVLKTALEGWFADQSRRAQAGARSDILSDHLVEMVMSGCNGQPGPRTAYWLNSKGVYPDARGVWPGTSRVAS